MNPEQLIAFCFILFGIGGFLYSLYIALKSYGAKKWKLSKAFINKSLIEEDCDGDGCSYKAKVNYTYNYNGKLYKSDKVAFGDFSNSSKYLARKVVKQYIEGFPNRVYVNPKRPKESVLLVGVKGLHILHILFFSIFIFMGLLFFISKG